MTKANDTSIHSGLTLERPLPEADNELSREERLVGQALEGLDNGVCEPHVDNLLRLVEQVGGDRRAVYAACLTLCDYYRGLYPAAIDKPDFDRAIYYANLSGDLGDKAPGACSLAEIYLMRCNRSEASYTEIERSVTTAAETLLPYVRANNARAIQTTIGILYGDGTSPFFDKNSGVSGWGSWGLLYQAYARWSVHPENKDGFEREEAKGRATQILRDLEQQIPGFNKLVESQLDEFKAHVAIAVEAHPQGDDLAILKKLELHATGARRRRTAFSVDSGESFVFFLFATAALFCVLTIIFINSRIFGIPTFGISILNMLYHVISSSLSLTVASALALAPRAISYIRRHPENRQGIIKKMVAVNLVVLTVTFLGSLFFGRGEIIYMPVAVLTFVYVCGIQFLLLD